MNQSHHVMSSINRRNLRILLLVFTTTATTAVTCHLFTMQSDMHKYFK